MLRDAIWFTAMTLLLVLVGVIDNRQQFINFSIGYWGMTAVLFLITRKETTESH